MTPKLINSNKHSKLLLYLFIDLLQFNFLQASQYRVLFKQIYE